MPDLLADLIPSQRERLVAALTNVPYSPTLRAAQLEAFHTRFGPNVLSTMAGPELLERMHGRSTTDSMAYWLEFKNDDTFHARDFGSIAGGSAFKFGFYQRAEDGAWVTGNPRQRVVLSLLEAQEAACTQRDELMAAHHIVSSLPEDPTAPEWGQLADAVRSAAPTIGHLSFFHKTLALWNPTRIDDYHSVAYQTHMLASLGLVPSSTTLFDAAPLFRALLLAIEEAPGATSMNQMTTALNRCYGTPSGHWRVGTTDDQTDFWPMMQGTSQVAVGWPQLGNLEDLLSGLDATQGRLLLKQRLEELFPQQHPSARGRAASQVWMFFGRMQESDVIYAAKGMTVRGIGRVRGAYEYEAGHPFPHRRKVRWETTTAFKAPTKAGLLTTVANLQKAVELHAAAAHHIDEHPVRGPVSGHGVRRNLGPIEAQLDRKGQVILYGPPGTGKTFHALRAARDMVAHDTHQKPWSDLTDAEKQSLDGRQEGARRIWTCTFHPAFSYEDFVEGLRPKLVDKQLTFEPRAGLFRRICEQAGQAPHQRFVLIVDEFNRGDAPRIFGELLTLLERDKRGEVFVTLPTSGKSFTVPKNVRLLATMNTADRSIALLDAALRRRFGFLEFLPDPSILAHATVGGVSLAALLTAVNQRLVRTLGPLARNLQVGHAYFMDGGRPFGSLAALRSALQYDLLPLLQEYCADDPDQLLALLGEELYDRSTQRVRNELFDLGHEERLLDALAALGGWTRASTDEGEDEDEDGEDDEASDTADG